MMFQVLRRDYFWEVKTRPQQQQLLPPPPLLMEGQSCFDKTLSGVVEMENLAWSEPELAGNKAAVHLAETLDLCLEGTWT